MCIITLLLLLLYIILSHIYFYKIWRELDGIYKELKNKYDSKQWVSGIMNPLIRGMIEGYSMSKYNSTRYTKHNYIK